MQPLQEIPTRNRPDELDSAPKIGRDQFKDRLTHRPLTVFRLTPREHQLCLVFLPQKDIRSRT